VASSSAAGHTIAADVQQPAQPSAQPSQPPQVDINIHRSGRAWYASPVWIAIGAIAIVVLVLLVVVATGGGGGTTIIRD